MRIKKEFKSLDEMSMGVKSGSFFFACPKKKQEKAPAGICIFPRHPGQNGRNILRFSRSGPNDSAHLQAGIKVKKQRLLCSLPTLFLCGCSTRNNEEPKKTEEGVAFLRSNRIKTKLTFGELRCLAGLFHAVFLALHLARITRQVTGFLQLRTQADIILKKRA